MEERVHAGEDVHAPSINSFKNRLDLRADVVLPSGRSVAADVCVTRVERVHHGDGPANA